MSDPDVERCRLTAELDRLLKSLQILPPSQQGYERLPYLRAMSEWDQISTVVKDAAEWLSLAGNPNALASKPWLLLQLNCDGRRAREWPINDLVRDLSFIRKILVAAGGVVRQQPSIRPGSESSRDAKPFTRERADTTPGQRRTRKTDPAVRLIKKQVRELREAGLGYKAICDRLGSGDRPPRATWRELPWPVAYKRHTSAVTKWLSEACSDLPSVTI